MSRTREAKRVLHIYSVKLSSIAEDFHKKIMYVNIEKGSKQYKDAFFESDTRWRNWCKLQIGKRIIQPNANGFTDYINKA